MVQLDINSKPSRVTIPQWLKSIDEMLAEKGYSKTNQKQVDEIVELLKTDQYAN